MVGWVAADGLLSVVHAALYTRLVASARCGLPECKCSTCILWSVTKMLHLDLAAISFLGTNNKKTAAALRIFEADSQSAPGQSSSATPCPPDLRISWTFAQFHRKLTIDLNSRDNISLNGLALRSTAMRL